MLGYTRGMAATATVMSATAATSVPTKPARTDADNSQRHAVGGIVCPMAAAPSVLSLPSTRS